MNKIDYAKLVTIEHFIKVGNGKITKLQVLQGIEKGCVKDIVQYVKKHDKLPQAIEIVNPYWNDARFQKVMGMVDIDVNDILKVVNKYLVGGSVDEFKKDEVKELPEPGRNDPCPCGSGKKYKKCCIRG